MIAYLNLEATPYPLYYYRYKGAGDANRRGRTGKGRTTSPTATNRCSPAAPPVCSWPRGLQRRSVPDTINVRRFEGTGFGAPHTLVSDSETSLFVGGAIAQSPSGNRLAVAWPGKRGGDGAYVMRLFTSTDGGGSYAESHIAHLAERLRDRSQRRPRRQRRRGRLDRLHRQQRSPVADLSPVAPFVDNQRPPTTKAKPKSPTRRKSATTT